MKVHWQFLLFCSFISIVIADEVVSPVSDPAATTSSTTATTPAVSAAQTSESTVDPEAETMAKAQQSRDGLHTFLIENPNAKSCRASPMMQKFIEANKLQALPNLGLEDLQRYLRSVDPSVNLKHVEVIHPHYLRYIQFLKNLRSRNRLIQYLNSKPSHTDLELAVRMDDFARGHGLLETQPNIAKSQFAALMLSKDNFISQSQIDKIYEVIPRYLSFLQITKAREDLLEKLAKPPTAVMSKLRPEIDVFITKFEMGTLTNPTLEELKGYIAAKDALMYPEDVEKVAGIYKTYKEFLDRIEVRDAFIAKAKATGTPDLLNNKLIHAQLDPFMTKYALKEVDVFNTELYEKHIKERDDLISPADIALVQQYAKRYNLYAKKQDVYTKAKTFVDGQTGTQIPPSQLQPHMVPLIETFELTGIDAIADFVAKINDYLGTETATTTADKKLFDAFIGFETYYLKKDTFTKLLQYVKTADTTSTEATAQAALAGVISSFLDKFSDLKDEVYYPSLFIKKVREFDSTISKEDIATVHPHVKKYKIDQQKTLSRNELKSELAKLDGDETKTEANKNIKIDTFIAVYGFTADDMVEKPAFVKKLKTVDATATGDDDANLYELVKTRMASSEFTDKISQINRVPQPGEFGDDGEVIPPTGGFKRFWYNFFKFFGAKPHKVAGVASYKDLFFLKRWFNTVYKWLTDINFYILVDAKPDAVTSESGAQAEGSGDQAAASGDQAQASGDQAQASGDQAQASGDQAQASGDQVQASGGQVQQSGGSSST